MFYCEPCRVDRQWSKGLRGQPTSMGPCEECGVFSACYDVPSSAIHTYLEGDDKPKNLCSTKGCSQVAITGRILCLVCAFPAERSKSSRQLAIEQTRRNKANRKAKVFLDK